MISNERVQRLIACDRDTLIELMAVAMDARRVSAPCWVGHYDVDIDGLLDEARARNEKPVTMKAGESWMWKQKP